MKYQWFLSHEIYWSQYQWFIDICSTCDLISIASFFASVFNSVFMIPILFLFMKLSSFTMLVSLINYNLIQIKNKTVYAFSNRISKSFLSMLPIIHNSIPLKISMFPMITNTVYHISIHPLLLCSSSLTNLLDSPLNSIYFYFH